MQSITSKDGTKRRLFCLSCLKAGREWIGGELCDHFQNMEPVAPTATMDSPSQGNDAPSAAQNANADAGNGLPPPTP